ncbi:putative signaling protein (plasmid) [Peptoclostridium acidaminophilum DSM 3953]|uniref:Putative signaling protein n=1 Tax=Peptoclostridium acidaminophilum DSM 3953 TaxID=1286171 RepID=W8TIU0_PEPAC|nr:putative signaling protein [Peptoclostridium acidaminophilum DSM 3953]
MTAKELLDEDFIEWSQELIERKNLDRSRFEIEITERVINLEGKKLLAILKYLRGLGYKISIDDFGTGYNSLMSVGEIPFDLLKIDKYFIDRLKQREVRELVSSIINYTHGLDKMVVAEGVETKQQLDILKELMCDKVQGYYYSKPLLPYEFEEYYKKYSIKR